MTAVVCRAVARLSSGVNKSTHPSAGGLALGAGAYALWGVLPLYFHLLTDVPALQVLAHRIVWSVLLLVAIVLFLRRGRALLAAARGRTLIYLVASAALIAVNWLVYIWAVQNHHVLEGSLGYFINPLVNVALGVAVLGERLRPVQAGAIGVAAAGVLVLAASGGGALWISLVLAFSFALYGLVRKIAHIDSLGGLTIETLILLPFALVALGLAARSGTLAFGVHRDQDTLLLIAGIVTTVPLLMFAAAAKRMPYATLGLLQFIAPTLQFASAVFFGEAVRPIHYLTFGLIWTGCALYAADTVRAARAASVMRPD